MMPTHVFEPKIVSAFKEGYSRKKFLQDLTAGVIVGIVAIPLSIALAIASGVRPEQGLYTAVIAGFLISLLSGSRYQIGGPTGAFIVIVYGIIQKHGLEGLMVATIMAGVLLICMGLARMGDIIKFIPYPVTVGFTSGIALIIFITQIRDFFGLTGVLPDHFVDKIIYYAQNIGAFHYHDVFLGILTLVILMSWPRVTHRIPGALVAIIVTTAIVHGFHWPAETIYSRFGAIPTTLPHPKIPNINLDMLVQLSSPALTIALLAGIESLLSAVVADGMTGRKHRSNIELIAQGVANIASPMFGGIPATGAIARTATNIKHGGRTPMAGIFHAVTILIVALCFGKWAALIPVATLAGILIVVAYDMSEWHLFVKLFRGPKSDIVVLLITFFLTVLVDLTVAIEVGIVMAAFLFMRRMVDVTQVNSITDSLEEEDAPDDPEALYNRDVPAGVEVFEINGPFFFGAADKFKDTLREIKEKPKVLILRMRHVPTIDATGLRALEDLCQKAQKDKMTIIFSGLHAQPLKMIKRVGLLDVVGQDNLQETIDQALERARVIVERK